MFQFLNQSMVWLLALLAIPIIIHFFNFRRRKKVLFSNLWFLKSVQNRTKSYSNLKKLIILVLRVLFVIWFVIALMQPFIADEDNPAMAQTVYLDNSMSMQALNEKNVSLNTIAESYLEEKSQDLSKTYLTNTDQRTGIFSEVKNKMVLNAKPNDFDRIADQLRFNGKQSLWLSDFQKNGSGLESLLQDTLSQYRLVLLEQSIQSNLFVDSVFLSKPLGYQVENSLNIVVGNTGSQDRQGQLLRLTKDGRQLSALSFDLKANNSETFTIALSTNEPIGGNYTVELVDASLDFDNLFYFRLNDPKPIEVVMVSDAAPNRYLSSAFGNAEIFVKKTFRLSEIAPEDLRMADVVVLDHLHVVPDWLKSQLQEKNLILLVAPPFQPDANLESYSSLLGAGFTISSDTNQYAFSPRSLSHPLFNDMFDKRANLNMPKAKVLYRINGFSGQPLITLSNRDPFLTELRPNMFVFLGSLVPRFTDFVSHALFIPTIYRIAQQSADLPELAYRITDRPIQIGGVDVPAEILRFRGSDSEYIINPRYQDQQVVFSLPPTLHKPGFYQLFNERDTVATLALNYSKQESILDFYKYQELQDIFNGYSHVQVERVASATGPEDLTVRQNEPFPIWKYALILAIVFLVVELIVLRFFK